MSRRTSQTISSAALLALASLMGGCIVCDQLSTITIQPDGSAELVTIESNVHSSEAGSKGEEELRRYEREFIAGQSDEHRRIARAGGQVKESRLIRSQAPYSSLIVASLPNAEALEKAFTFSSDNGENIVTARFQKEGSRRRLSLLVKLPRDQVEGAASETTVQELRSSQADAISEIRFAVVNGTITGARGFTIAKDKQSALLEPHEILDMLRNHDEVEAFLEWNVAE